MNVGCVVLSYTPIGVDPRRIIAVRCNKGRGIILPGGRWEKGEAFDEAAAREYREEAGLEVASMRLVFGGVSDDGNFSYTFLATPLDYPPKLPAEMEIVQATWEDLLESGFRSYYRLLRQVVYAR